MKKSIFSNLMLVTQLGIVIATSIFIGVFAGIFVDRKLGTGILFTIIFLIFGIIGGFMAAYQLIQGDKNDEPRSK